MSATVDRRAHHRKPGVLTRHVLNRAVGWLNRRGVEVAGSRILAVRGRKSGEWRTTPVNPLEFRGERYLVAPRGHTQWVRNLRAAGGGELRLGRRVERFTAVELSDDEKPAVLRAYLAKWKWEVGAFFEGVGPTSDDEELSAAAHQHPAFRITLEE
ncbi:nitroreductase family deazaflavin-dependent oxidoreductase [Streptomyces sp. TRM43335]|uniref:Nitroreductase family deazaflavin-dependent oxidoreductase n=1 Tax=Streptomyces taklimakanensis TaxID=2569853 RepID=A0A6G2BI80_9ACTN|nr:nitroreductase family deazaflavin-dependent oxidoreductase [Streptomyces taklimakanensis]MTE21985.1 nitroreductase family deazaflavin-dependent oxidoreductase [Streptomyces taklimakanensis]